MSGSINGIALIIEKLKETNASVKELNRIVKEKSEADKSSKDQKELKESLIKTKLS